MWYDYYNQRKPKPRKVRGGIKAHSKRGDIGESWWARLWLESVLDFVYSDGSITKGKSYARRGQVEFINVEKGAITASVYGSSRTPYNLKISVSVLDRVQWKEIARLLSIRPAMMAELLAGRMPEKLNDIFENAELPLFPKEGEFGAECSCDSWEELCKHVMAVCFLLAEELDRDPFLILKMRGIEREKLLQLAGLSGKSKQEQGGMRSIHRLLQMIEPKRWKNPKYMIEPSAGDQFSKPLSMDPDEFWGREGQISYDPGGVSVPEVSAALPKRLGNFPFWRSKIKFVPTMEETYKSASLAGLEALLGDLKSYTDSEAKPQKKQRRGRPRKNED